MSNWIPNSYDVFYFNYKIVSQLTDLNKIKSSFQNVKSNFDNEYQGFLYFLEIVIIHTTYHLELLIGDKDLFDRIRWGNNTLEDPDFKKLLETNPEASFIVRLHSVRRKCSKNREKYDEKQLQETLSELNKLFLEIDLSLKNFHIIKRKKNSKTRENFVIFDHIVRNFNWFRFGPIRPEDTFDIDKEVPLHPGDILTYLMSDKQRSNYFLQDPRIERDNSHYFKGYKITLLILYTHFFPEREDYFSELFHATSDWKGLQTCYSQIMDEFNLRFDMDRQLYDLKEIAIQNSESKKQIFTLEELRKELRNREIRCFKDFYKDFNLITHYLFGADRLADCGLRSKLEIIQFDIIDSKESEKLTYYAIFNPMGGGLWDGSYWIFFKNPYGYGDPDEMKPIIDLLSDISSQPFDIKKIKISEKLIKDYYKRKDEIGQEKNRNQEIIKSSRGLLGEFLTLFYLIKRVGEENIVNIECHNNIQKTDIDVLIETKDSILIAQVKSFFYFNPAENDKIREHFRLINDNYKQRNKQILTFLVFMDYEIHDSEIVYLFEEKLKVTNELEITNQDIENQREKITQEFSRDKISVIYRIEIQKQLVNGKKTEDLVKLFNKIFNATPSTQPA